MSYIRKISSATILAFLIILPAANGQSDLKPVNWGQRKATSFSKLQKEFAQPDMMYAPFIFWFWDEPLNADKMREMSRVMCEQGFNPGYAHARKSMVKEESLPGEQWLGEQWFKSFDAALKEAKADDKYLGYCDEYWWPSFQAHGRVLEKHPELKAQSLNWKLIEIEGGKEVEIPDSYFVVAAALDGRLCEKEQKPQAKNSQEAKDTNKSGHEPAVIRSDSLNVIGKGEAFTWKAPADADWRVYVFNIYHHGGVDGGLVNCLDERLAPAFINIALKPYAERYGKELGKSIPGDFMDHEGDDGYRLAWSDSLDRQYKERYGQDIRLWMPLMIDNDTQGLCAKARWHWFDLVSDIYAGQFQKVTDWHESRGMYMTAHVCESSLPAQVVAVGDHMKILRSFTMPGQDCLGKSAIRVRDFKEIESVAEFKNVRAATELLGAGGFEGKQWETFTPAFLKKSINSVTAWGMSHIISHGVFTNRKFTGNPWPPDWYSENPMYPYMHLWTDFTRRASYINSSGYASANVLLYYPIESLWALTDGKYFSEESTLPRLMWANPFNDKASQRMNFIDRAYSKAMQDLTDARVEFLIGDKEYLNQMSVNKSKLTTGNFEFKTIILPPMDLITLETAGKLVQFAKSGGFVYALGELPTGSAENGMNDAAMKALMDELAAQKTFKTCPAEPDGTVSSWKSIVGWQYEKDTSGFGLKPLLQAGVEGLESPAKFVAGEFNMLQHRRNIDGRDFFWLANNDDEPHDCVIAVNGAKGQASIWDCETGKVSTVASRQTDSGSTVDLSFKPNEAYWLVFDAEKKAVKSVKKERPAEMLMAVDGPWKVTYSAAIQPVMEYPMTPAPEFADGIEKPLEDWSVWGLEKFSGLMDYSTSFNVKNVSQEMHIDLGKVCHTAEIWVNGKHCGARMWGPHTFDVSNAIRKGNNTLKVRVANLINNSYNDIQPSGLLGPVTLLCEK